LKYPDLRRAATWLGAFAYFYLGSRVKLPGVSVDHLMRFAQGARGGLLGLYELVSSGGLHRGAIVGIGIMPYLTARIYMRLARTVSPRIAALDNEDRIRRTRWLTGALAVIQSLGFASFLQRVPNVVATPGLGFTATTVLTLTAASLIAMWFGEQLTESDEPQMPRLSAPLERLSPAPALPAPATPASPPIHPHPSSDVETLRTRR
jgi:preprotein translocase subunit SecY